nr:inositol monophosphatase family protein [Blastococcus atacamensis]
MDGELVPLGSAGYKTLAVVRGEVDAYVHSGGMYQWDSAAPVAIARAAGLVTTRLDGSPLVYNAPDPSLPDLVVTRPELADRVLAAVRGGR